MCDLHLPSDKNALQYDVLRWAIEDILQKNPDCIAYAGDVTCDGNEAVYDFFTDKMNSLNIPFLYIPGNSDLRCDKSKDSIYHKASQCKNVVDGVEIYVVHDCNNDIEQSVFEIIENAGDGSVVFMHHPVCEHKNSERLMQWCENHKNSTLLYAHMHRFCVNENVISLPALDPDKSIGEPPCIIYFDTDTKGVSKSHYPSDIPDDLSLFFGISCYDPIKQIKFGIERKLKHLELRPNCVEVSFDVLVDLVKIWRKTCGKSLSVHLPDVCYKDGKITFDKGFDEIIKLINLLNADRVTLHVPKVKVGETIEMPALIDEICIFTADMLNKIRQNVIIGVENMHMTPKEKPDNSRRFGYTPEECLLFMRKLASKTKHKTGINFDIGHARNNAPFSQIFQISTWFSMLGEHIVGYHMHQVTPGKGGFINHMPITEVYGNLISFSSFFKCWEKGIINKAPVVFEMRPEDAYEITLNTFNF